MSDEEYISDEEFLAKLQNIDNEKLIQSLQSCGHDGYYNDLYYPIIEEIKRRLSLYPSAEPERTAKVEDYGGCQRCSACDNPVFEDDEFCSGCGSKLDWSEE